MRTFPNLIFSSQLWSEDNCTRRKKKSYLIWGILKFMYIIFCLCDDAVILIVYSFSRPVEVVMEQIYFSGKAADDKSHKQRSGRK